MFSYKAIYVIIVREFKRFFRQRGRLLVTISRPLLWLFIVGAGFTSMVNIPADLSAVPTGQAGISYKQFILPGIIGLTILFSSIFSTISVVWDREFDFLREMLVAPISRTTIVMGKILSGTALSIFQGVILLFVSPFLSLSISFHQFAAMVLLIALVSLAITAMGLVIASYLTSLEGFNVIMNFIVLPMFFLSGALYPVNTLPPVLQYLTFVNPLSYGIDAFKHVLLGSALPPLGPEFPIILDIGAVIIFSIVMIILASLSFERKG
ncbi:MAG: ABC transporter permease [Deltaproteobacteria bacterium]|nr:ABC transporter permease [Deltaproteobacteria bacterium]